jgi:hypothetical protein
MELKYITQVSRGVVALHVIAVLTVTAIIGDFIPINDLAGGSFSVWCVSEGPFLSLLRQFGQHWASSRRPDRSARDERRKNSHGERGRWHCPRPSYSLLAALYSYFLSTLEIDLKPSPSTSQAQVLSEANIPLFILNNLSVTFNELYHYVDIILAGITALTGQRPRIRIQYIQFPLCELAGINGGEAVLVSLLQACQYLHISNCYFPDLENYLIRTLRLLSTGSRKIIPAGGEMEAQEEPPLLRDEVPVSCIVQNSRDRDDIVELAVDDATTSCDHDVLMHISPSLPLTHIDTSSSIKQSICPHLTDLLISHIDVSSTKGATSAFSALLSVLLVDSVDVLQGSCRLKIEVRRCTPMNRLLWEVPTSVTDVEQTVSPGENLKTSILGDCSRLANEQYCSEKDIIDPNLFHDACSRALCLS